MNLFTTLVEFWNYDSRYIINISLMKICSKLSSNTLLRLLRIFIRQTLVKKVHFSSSLMAFSIQCSNLSTTPITPMGCRQCSAVFIKLLSCAIYRMIHGAEVISRILQQVIATPSWWCHAHFQGAILKLGLRATWSLKDRGRALSLRILKKNREFFFFVNFIIF